MFLFNPFVINVPILYPFEKCLLQCSLLYPLKTPENQGVIEGSIGPKRVKKLLSFLKRETCIEELFPYLLWNRQSTSVCMGLIGSIINCMKISLNILDDVFSECRNGKLSRNGVKLSSPATQFKPAKTKQRMLTWDAGRYKTGLGDFYPAFKCRFFQSVSS